MFSASPSERFFRYSITGIKRALCHRFNKLSESPADQSVGNQWVLGYQWFLESQLDELKTSVSTDYCRKLDRAGLLDGEPRVFKAISRTLGCVIAYSLAPHSLEKLLSTKALAELFSPERFGACLTLAELNAIPTVVKLVILDRIASLLSGPDFETTKGQGDIHGAIECLRSLLAVRWEVLIESVSAVHQVLSREPSGTYSAMDFESRDYYRRAVEELALESGQTEEYVARIAVVLSTGAFIVDRESKQAHVGYFLIGEGKPQLRERAQLGLSWRTKTIEFVLRFPDFFYIGGVIAATALLTLALVRTLSLPAWFLALLCIPCSQVAVAAMNLLVNLTIPTRRLPRLDFSKGIPETCSTFVVVPTLLLSRRDVERLVERLEVHYLANRDAQLRFALLTDFPDSSSPSLESDPLIDLCASRIRRLNRKYASTGRSPFYLFHRKSEWNEAQRKWIGRERKRGKIEAFNRYLTGTNDEFDVKVGDMAALASTRYVITVDTDTQLPLGSAHKLVGTLAHPLHKAVVDPATKMVREGYAILQPRVSISLESAGKSRFAGIFSGQTGLDPYTTAISDVYQDLFGQATFTGKGIYDLYAFQTALDGRFPDNTLLSHDLIEGEHARTGLVTDVEVIEDFPRTYNAHRKRKHRWIRGDWQIFQWLLPRVPHAFEGSVSNPLPPVSRWKIADNLRRSLFEISLLTTLIASWVFIPSASVRILLAAAAIVSFGAYAGLLTACANLRKAASWMKQFQDTAAEFLRAQEEALLTLITLPDQARVAADAILRTLGRLFVTRRRLLDWESMAESEKHGGGALDGQFIVCAAGLLAVAAMDLWNPGAAWTIAYFVMAGWAASCVVIPFVNNPPTVPRRQPRAEVEFLRDIALRTWRYFLDFSHTEDHWLVPDNIQEEPETLARRTSPTNIGLQLASNVAALDFGYLTREELSDRLGDLLDTIQQLDHYRGHLFNWYNTRTLSTIGPRFVSTVDSGNLAAALIAVKQACESLEKQPLVQTSVLDGIRDHCICLRKALPYSARRPAVLFLLAGLIRRLSFRPNDLFLWQNMLDEVQSKVQDLNEYLDAASESNETRDPHRWDEMRYWQAMLSQRVRAARRSLFDRAPWLSRLSQPEFQAWRLDSRFEDLVAALSAASVPGGIFAAYNKIDDAIHQLLDSSTEGESGLSQLLRDLRDEVNVARVRTQALMREFTSHARVVARFVHDMDFGFLFDPNREMLRIGYDVDGHKLAEHHYDLLASEARTAVFLAVAKGDVPRQTWFRLGRKMTSFRGYQTLLSWSGTMFEYLMPSIFMKTYAPTLLGESLNGVVQVQQAYAKELDVPWGISESSCSSRNLEMHYDYRAFGVPAVSLQNEKPENLVIAPYASMLALMVDRKGSAENLREMAFRGWTGRYGFFEAVDFRSAEGGALRCPTVVRSFMAHHQGMGLLALCNSLLGNPMQQRFHAEPIVAATELLLQERMGSLPAWEPQSRLLAALIGESDAAN